MDEQFIDAAGAIARAPDVFAVEPLGDLGGAAGGELADFQTDGCRLSWTGCSQPSHIFVFFQCSRICCNTSFELFVSCSTMRSAVPPVRNVALWCALLLLTCFPVISTGQPEAQPAAVALSGQIEVVRLIDLAAQRLRVNVEFDANALKALGQVTLRLASDVSDEDLWQLTNRILISRGYVSVRVPGRLAYAIVKVTDAAHVGSVPDLTEGEPIPGYRSVIVPTHHKIAKDLAEAAAKVLSKPGGSAVVVKEGPEDGAIAIADLSSRVQQAIELIRRLDMPLPVSRTVIEEIGVRNYTGQQMAALATELNTKREVISGQRVAGEVTASPGGESILLVCEPERQAYWRDLIATLDKHDHVDSVSYSCKGSSATDLARLIGQAVPDVDHRLKLVVDDRSGSVFATGSPVQHEQIRSIIERLDAAAASHRPLRSFVIRNRPVQELQSILEQLVQKGVLGESGSSTSSTPVNAGSLGPWPPHRASPQDQPFVAAGSSSRLSVPSPGSEARDSAGLYLSADEGTNTLIAIGEPALLSQVEVLLQSLDVRQPQVMLEVLIVSLSESQTLDLGLELEKLSGGETRTRVSSLFGLSSRDAAGNVNAGNGLGFTGAVLNPGDFSVVFRALQTLNKGRSLSMPKLLVTNNQQATLDSVLEQPFASTNASNTVTTTSFGGTKPAGTQITLKPQISGGGEGEHLLLDYSVSLSAFVGAAASASLPPPRQENKLQSMASLPDGHTVVVGGIELTSDGKATNQVPGLGAIPVLGEAFKNRSNNASRSRFYVFIRANILRARGYDDLKYLSELVAPQVGIDDGWPVVEPRVIR